MKTCNDSTWRERLIHLLKINYFNPVVKDWTPECQKKEIEVREISDYVLYVITPKMTGFYSIAEAVEDSNKRPDKTLFCYLIGDEDKEFNGHQIKSLQAIANLIKKNGGNCFYSLKDIANFVNEN